MVNQYVWIGIVVGIFFVGIGIGYSIQSNTSTVPMMMNTQQMQQMMNNPDQMAQWQQTMMNNPEMMQQLRGMMAGNMTGMMDEMMNQP
jgi:hypothetical protein